MVIYGSKQDLLYSALRRVYTGTADSIIIKTSGEFLMFDDLASVVGMVMLGSFNKNDKVEIMDDIHEMNMSEHMQGMFSDTLEEVVNAIILSNDSVD